MKLLTYFVTLVSCRRVGRSASGHHWAPICQSALSSWQGASWYKRPSSLTSSGTIATFWLKLLLIFSDGTNFCSRRLVHLVFSVVKRAHKWSQLYCSCGFLLLSPTAWSDSKTQAYFSAKNFKSRHRKPVIFLKKHYHRSIRELEKSSANFQKRRSAFVLRPGFFSLPSEHQDTVLRKF